MLQSTMMKLKNVSRAERISTVTLRLVLVKLAASWEIRWSGLSISSTVSSLGLSR